VRAVVEMERDLVGEGLTHTDEGRLGHCWWAGGGGADGWTMMGDDGWRRNKGEEEVGGQARNLWNGSYACV
jgi:hypothetical protein